MGIPGLLIYCAGYKSSHSRSADRWSDRVRLCDLEPLFTCAACGPKGRHGQRKFQLGAGVTKNPAFRYRRAGVKIVAIVRSNIVLTGLVFCIPIALSERPPQGDLADFVGNVKTRSGEALVHSASGEMPWSPHRRSRGSSLPKSDGSGTA